MSLKCLRIGLGGLAVCAAFVLPASAQAPADRTVLTRFHSPTFGDPAAKVEIVEFFDPACEACRAMYPFVKKLLEEHRGRVRLTLRYAKERAQCPANPDVLLENPCRSPEIRLALAKDR